MNEWIEINLPWNKRVYAEHKEYVPYPDLSEKVKAHFGYSRDELLDKTFPGRKNGELEFDHPIYKEYNRVYSELSYDKNTIRNSDNKAVKIVLEYHRLDREINEWLWKQPEYIAVFDENNRIEAANKEQQAELSFRGKGLNKAGTVIEYEENGKTQRMMIGDINEIGGVCDDCRGISDDAIILRYIVVWDNEK
jgi:hypothetical protein